MHLPTVTTDPDFVPLAYVSARTRATGGGCEISTRSAAYGQQQDVRRHDAGITNHSFTHFKALAVHDACDGIVPVERPSAVAVTQGAA